MAQSIWTAVYVIGAKGKDDVPLLDMFFTVASDESAAQRSFYSEMCGRYITEKLRGLAPTIIAEMPRFDESIDSMVRRLRRLGYEFVLPQREEIPDEKVGRIVCAFMNMHKRQLGR